MSYAERVQALEDQGLTTSDAQGVVDAEDRQVNQPDKTKIYYGHSLRRYGKIIMVYTPDGYVISETTSFKKAEALIDQSRRLR